MDKYDDAGIPTEPGFYVPAKNNPDWAEFLHHCDGIIMYKLTDAGTWFLINIDTLDPTSSTVREIKDVPWDNKQLNRLALELSSP